MIHERKNHEFVLNDKMFLGKLNQLNYICQEEIVG